MSDRERRLVFGEIAELYDAARPAYPVALVDDLVTWAESGGAGSPCALEVGAGTGKATRLISGRGVTVLAIEPSAEMAVIVRRTPGVEVIVSDFESADLGGRRFPLVYAAQAWHWVSQPAGYALARAALTDGGHLVVFWNRPRWEESALRRELNQVYEAHVPPELRGGPLHPAPGAAWVFSGEDWKAEIAGVAGFAGPEVRGYDWQLEYTTESYCDLLGTISEVRLLEPATRTRFLEQMRRTIAAHGDGFTLPMQTRTCIVRAA